MSISSILLMILGLSVLVIVHEAGHYLVARAFGMRVLRFSVGFGKSILEWQPKGSPTVFSIGLVPVLAYVQIDGMNPVEEHDPNDPGLFPNKSLFARIATIVAGPLANYLLASLFILTIAPFAWPTLGNGVGRVMPNQPAAVAGLQPGDHVVEANGVPTATFEDIVRVTTQRANRPTRYVIERNGQRIPLTITPRNQNGRGLIGFETDQQVIYRALPISDAARLAVQKPFEMSVATLEGLGGMLKARTTEGLSGPLGLGKELYKRAQQGPMTYLLALISLSVALGLFNLLPFPALDGGRLMFLAYELITRRKPNERLEAIVHGVGLVSLLLLVAYVTIFRDLGLS